MEDAAKQEILEAIGVFAESVDQRFESIDKRFESIDKRFDQIDKRFESIDRRFDLVDKRFDATDRKIDNVKGDLVHLLRKEDEKMNTLISVLAKKSVINPKETREILAVRPFPSGRPVL